MVVNKIINNNLSNVKLEQRIKTLESLIKKEPIMLLSHTGEVWISEKAKKILSEKKINTTELLGWLKIGVKHLTEASFYNLTTLMVQLPHNPQCSDVLVILRDSHRKEMSLLTATEKKVLRYLVRGFSNKNIASNLNIGPGTVNAHLDNVYRKLGVSNRVSAICEAIKLGIVVPAA